MNHTFAENMRAARLRTGMTQNALAAKLKTTQSRISRWEKGERNPRKFTKERIAAALGQKRIGG